MKFLLCLLLLTATSAASDADFAVVRDSDGFANVREKGSLEAKVSGKVKHGQLVWLQGNEKADSKWVGIAYNDEKGAEQFGFINRSRVLPLNKFTKIPAISSGDDHIKFKKGDIAVDIAVSKFDRKMAESVTIVHHKDGAEAAIEINRRPFFGCDGGLPTEKYSKFEIRSKTHTLQLPNEAIGDLFQPNTDKTMVSVFHNAESDEIYVTSANSDGAGGYLAAFKIVAGKFVSRLVASP